MSAPQLPHAELAATLRAAVHGGAILDRAGARILAAGHVQAVIDAVEALPPAARTPRRQVLLAHARQVRGDADGALACCAEAAGDGPLAPALAWRMGLVHYQAGDPTTALAVYDRARLDGTDPVAEAHLLAWSANAHWMLGDPAAARHRAERAHDSATVSGDPGALAAAHSALALSAMLAGDRRSNGRHWALATAAAERAGDVLQLIRIRASHGSHLVEEGFPADAIGELEQAALLAEQVGFAVAVGLCRTNLGQCLLQLAGSATRWRSSSGARPRSRPSAGGSSRTR